MTEQSTLESTSVTERLVLYELAELAERDETPAQAPAILRRCHDRLETLEGVVGGRVSEGDLVSACRSLGDLDLVTERRPDATSPTGKGRPAYALAVDPDEVRKFVRDDERFRDVASGDPAG